MKYEADGVVIEEFFGLKPKMYLYLLNDNSEYKKAKDVNRNIVATISLTNIKMLCLRCSEYKDVMFESFDEQDLK